METQYTSVVHRTCQPENNVFICKLSGPLIICTEQTNIYKSTFPNALNPKKPKNRDIGGDIFFDKCDRSLVSRIWRNDSEIQNTPVSKRSTLSS